MRGLRVRAVLATAVLAALLSSPALGAGTITSVQLEGVVDPFVASYVERVLSSTGGSAVLLTIDTPGGLDSSMRRIIKAILNSSKPVICYVSPQGARAASAGTFILLACHIAAMAPGTNVGAAHPVGIAGVIEQKKATNDAAAYIRSLAEQRGRNADWAEKAVRDSESVSAEEALRLGVIDVVASDVDSLLERIDGRSVEVTGQGEVPLETIGADVEPAGVMGLGSRLLHALLQPSVAFILFYVGLMLVVVEVLHPGVSVPGVLGVVSMVGAFTAFGMLPVQLIGLVLLVASVVFFLLELKHPGLGFPTVGGLVSLLLGGVLLFDRDVPGAQVSPGVIIPVAIAAGLFFYFVVRAALRARALPVDYRPATLVGAEGIAITDLNPVGSARVALEDWTAEAIGGEIPKGTKVKVVGLEGLKLRVEVQKQAEMAGEAKEKT